MLRKKKKGYSELQMGINIFKDEFMLPVLVRWSGLARDVLLRIKVLNWRLIHVNCVLL